MPVEWTYESKSVHYSYATWVGPSLRDGGKAILDAAFETAREQKLQGRMIVDFGIGGSIRHLEFIQSEDADTPTVE